MEEELGKVGVNFFLLYHLRILTIVPKSWTSLCELIHFISRVHLLHWVNTYGWFGWMRRLRWLKESNALAEWDGCGGWRSRIRWLKESNAVAGGEECDGRGRRMLWQKETKANHNFRYSIAASSALYIFWFLHQTTTLSNLYEGRRKLYIFWFLHQTTTPERWGILPSTLYIFWFLHQTTTLARTIAVGCGCISFDSYIKPQPSWWLTIRPACCISFDSYIKPQPINDCVFIK